MADPFNVAGSRSGSDPFGVGASRTSGGPAGAAVGKTNHRGFLGKVGHAITKTGSEAADIGYNAAAGAVELGKLEGQALGHDASTLVHHPTKTQSLHDFAHGNSSASKKLGKVEAQQARSFKESAQHPLRHPADTILNATALLSLGAGGVARAGAAGRALKTGEGAKAAAGELLHPTIPARTLRVGDTKVPGHYSRSASSRVAQRAGDKLLEKGAEKTNRVGVRAENMLHRRAAKWNARNERVADAVARAPGTVLAAAGKDLKPEEMRALRLVAEETPVARRLRAQEMRAARAKGPEVARHQERIDLTRKAQAFLDEGPGGKPVFKPEAVKLAKVYDLLKSAAGDREGMLKHLGLMDKQALQAAKTKTARVAAGATVDKKTGEVVGAADITPSAEAVHIGNAVERSRFTGKPRVSSTGTFGHTRKPSSLKVATGGAVEHALERNDIPRVVAERHSEAVRLAKIDRLVQKVKGAGEAAPRRKDDVFVWTNKLISNERIPAEVRSFLHNPEGIAKLAPDEQHSLFEKVKESVLQQEDWRDQSKVEEFKQHAKEGKGVFVPRRLLGEAARRDYSIGHMPGVKFVDAVNNAQKAGLVYLKLNYPIIQGVSNTAMGLIHQGFAYPKNLTRAVRLAHAIGPELTAVVDDIMGQGAVMQAAFEGQGAVSHLSQRLARVMSHGIDTPARRAAFLHEAANAGFGKPKMFEALLTDERHADDLSEVAQRAKEAIVDYGELGPVERSVVRRLLFVYPWQKGATKYAAHFWRDHPVQAAIVGNLAEQAKGRADSELGPVPSYLNGVFTQGDRLINPAGANFFQTPAQIGQALGGLVTGNPATASGADFLSPFPGIVMGLAERRDSLGRPLAGNAAANIRDMTLAQTPAAALARAAVGSGGGKAGDLARALVGNRTSSKTFPNPHDAYWRFLFGGLYPRQYDRGALNQNAAREKTGR